MKLSFEDLYVQLEKNNIEKFKEIEKSAKKESIRNTILSLILCGLLDIFLFNKILNFTNNFNIASSEEIFSMQKIMMFMPILIWNILIVVLIFGLFSKRKREYINIFKDNIISLLISNFYDDLIYEPKNKMPREIYDAARYNEYYNRYYSDDYFNGILCNKYNIQMAEVKTEKVTTSRSGGRRKTVRHLKFHGLFTKIIMDKSIQTSLQIRGNNKVVKQKQVKMDSQEFEKYFDVASDNKIITMQILTHDVMNMLIDFEIKSGIRFDISIYGEKMYLRFHTGGIFELKSLKRGAFDKELLNKYYYVLEFTNDLAKKMIKIIENVKI